MPQVILELSANERRLLQAYKEAVAADKSLRDSVDATGESGKRAGKKIADGMISGAKEAGAEVRKEFGSMTKEGQRELKDLAKILRTMGPEGRAAAQQLSRHLATAGREGVESVGDIIDKIEKIDNTAARAARKARREFNSMADKQKLTAGPAGIKQVAAYAAKWASVAGAIGTVAAAMNKVRETNARALDSLEGNKSGDKRLLQVSSDVEDFQKLRGKADQLASRHGIGRDEARNLMFSARSENFEGAVDFIASNQQILDVEGQATVAGQIPGLFKNETLSPQQAINMTLAGAAASRLDFGQIARSLPSAAEGGAIAGASANETMATLSVLAGRFKSGETAADRIKALATRIGMDEGGEGMSAEEAAAKQATEDRRVKNAERDRRGLIERRGDIEADLEEAKGREARTDAQKKARDRRVRDLESDLFRADRDVQEFDMSRLERKTFSATKGRESVSGRGLLGAVEALQGMSDEDRRDFLGDSQEVNAAYKIIVEELANIRAREGVISQAREATGTSASPTAQRRAAAARDPKLKAVLEKNKSENRRQIEEENRRAVEEGSRVAGRDRAIAEAEARGDSKLKIAGVEMADDFGNLWGVGGVAENLLGGDLNNLTLQASRSLNNRFGDSLIGIDTLEGRDRSQTEALLLASSNLQKRRRSDPNAIFSQQDVATYLQGATGQQINPDAVTDEQRVTLTREVIEASEGVDAYSGAGRQQQVVDASASIAQEMLATLRLIESGIKAGSEAQKRTADNTNNPADPSLVIQLAAQQ